MVASKGKYRGTILTNYHAERINVAEDLAQFHTYKTLNWTGDGSWTAVLLRRNKPLTYLGPWNVCTTAGNLYRGSICWPLLSSLTA